MLLPLAFLLAGTAASFSVYSYARLGTAFPSRGGGAVLGGTGFLVIAAAAILATASAVNATLFASANIGADLADSGQLPAALARPWLRSTDLSLPVSAAVAINAALFVSQLIDTISSGSPATWITFLAVLAGSFVLTAWLRRGR